MDLVSFQDFHNFMVFIIQHSSYFGIGQGPINAKVLEGARGNAQEFPDFIGFEPFLDRWSVLVL